MIKMLFVHNTAKPYRIPFFLGINEIYDVRFIFTHMDVVHNKYDRRLNPNNELSVLRYKSLKNYMGLPLGIVQVLLSYDYDLIIDSFGSFESAISLLAAKTRGRKIILFSEMWDYDEKRNDIKSIILLYIFRLMLSRIDSLLVPGSRHKECFISLGMNAEKIFIMPNARNAKIIGEEIKNHRQYSNDEKVVLYVGRLIKRKGIEYLISAVSRLNNEGKSVKLDIIGKGELRNELELLSARLCIIDKVNFIGYVSDEILEEYYNNCELVVIPSINCGIKDPWVFVVNEAMVHGKPVIATDSVGAAFDMIHNDENGFIVPERNADAIYEAINKIIYNPELAEKMGRRSKRIIQEGFLFKHMVEGFVKAVDYVLLQKK